jgi:hypothetical protein
MGDNGWDVVVCGIWDMIYAWVLWEDEREYGMGEVDGLLTFNEAGGSKMWQRVKGQTGTL